MTKINNLEKVKLKANKKLLEKICKLCKEKDNTIYDVWTYADNELKLLKELE